MILRYYDQKICDVDKSKYYSQANHLTQTWLDKWSEAHSLIKVGTCLTILYKLQQQQKTRIDVDHVLNDFVFITQDSDLSIRGLQGRRSSSYGIIIDSQLPHLIGMDEDILSTGVIIFHLKVGRP